MTRQVRRQITPRAAAFLDWQTGHGTAGGGGRFSTTARPTAGEIVELAALAGVERVFLTGERPWAGDNDLYHAWAHTGPEGWEMGPHYLERAGAEVLRFTDPDVRRRVELLQAAEWFGAGVDDVELCATAWAHLGELVESKWPGAALLATPATTGRELIVRSIPYGASWPCLSDELADLIRSTSGQGRIQLVDHQADEIPRLVEYDGRVMYGALCKELPGGPARWGSGEHSYGPYARSRVRARWTVPPGWDHLGLLPTHDDAGGTWRYPDRPGETAAGWVDGVELHLARRWGWDVDVLEHVVWPKYRGAGPLDGWAARLLELIGRQRRLDGPVAALAARALRQVLISAIGALVGRTHVVSRSSGPVEDGFPLPAAAVDPRMVNGLLVWGEHRRPPWPEMIHPEWSAAVWARCRARMLDGPGGPGRPRTGALHVPRSTVLAIRTDALYLTDDPGWHDDGEPGRLHRRVVREGPFPTPRRHADVLAIRDGA